MKKTALLAAAGGILVLGALGYAGAQQGWFGGGQQQAGGDIPIDNDDIAGVVASSSGPEAGVWVVAETDDLGTKFIRSVVTDDQGRYLMPDLPPANYKIFARGYGLVDSPKLDARPGTHINLEPAVAPPTKRRRRRSIPRSIGSRCSKCRRRTNSLAPAKATAATESRPM
jgi:hypothetical protein